MTWSAWLACRRAVERGGPPTGRCRSALGPSFVPREPATRSRTLVGRDPPVGESGNGTNTSSPSGPTRAAVGRVTRTLQKVSKRGRVSQGNLLASDDDRSATRAQSRGGPTSRCGTGESTCRRLRDGVSRAREQVQQPGLVTNSRTSTIGDRRYRDRCGRDPKSPPPRAALGRCKGDRTSTTVPASGVRNRARGGILTQQVVCACISLKR